MSVSTVMLSAQQPVRLCPTLKLVGWLRILSVIVAIRLVVYIEVGPITCKSPYGERRRTWLVKAAWQGDVMVRELNCVKRDQLSKQWMTGYMS